MQSTRAEPKEKGNGGKTSPFLGSGSTRAERIIEIFALLVAIGFALSIVNQGLFERADFFLPTYDNSMLHAGRARFVMDTGFYPSLELVFGGVTPTYHVPAYPSLVAAFGELSGLSWFWSIRVIALLFAVLLPLAAYCLAKRASGGNAFAGAAAAFMILLTAGVSTWGMRTTPISLGVITVLALLWLVLERNWLLVVFGGVMLALTHQPSLLAFFGTMCVFFIASNAGAAWAFLRKSGSWTKREAGEFLKSLDWLPFVGGAAALLPYLAWHISKTGLTCLTLKCLPQGNSHEFGESVNLVDYFKPFKDAADNVSGGVQTFFVNVPQFLGLIGVLWVAFDKRVDGRAKLLLYSWLLWTLLLVKNDVFGIGVFTQRFLTFFDESVAIFAGVFVGGLLVLVCSVLEKRFSSNTA